MPTQIGSLQFTFEGNRLTGCNTSDKNITFTYDMKGLRKTKKYGSTVFDYYYSGDKLLLEDTNNYSNRFLYDEKGQLYGFIQNGNKYFYVRDIMNNILGISSQTGELVVKYNYDAYGKLLSTTGTLASTVGVQNPFLYKGYIYDRETQLYYCKSRYYDPNIGRWISPDAMEYLNPTSINGLNLYCYCNNNPILYVDSDGHEPISIGNITDTIFTFFQLIVNSAFIGSYYSIVNAVKPNNIGAGLWALKRSEVLKSFEIDVNSFKKLGNVLAVITVGIQVIDGMLVDYNRGYNTDRIISNAVVNIVIYSITTIGLAKLGGFIGTFIPIPIVGTAIGTAAGYMAGLGVNRLMELDVNGKTVIDHIRDFIYDSWKSLFD